MDHVEASCDETGKWNRTSPLSILYYFGLRPGRIFATVRSIFLRVAIPSGSLVYVARESGLGWKWTILISLSIVFVFNLGRALCKYHSFLWQSTSESISVKSGIFHKAQSDIKWSRVRAVSTSRDPLQRRIGLCSVALDTAGSADAEISIPNIPVSVAQELQAKTGEDHGPSQYKPPSVSPPIGENSVEDHVSEIQMEQSREVLFRLSILDLLKSVLCSRGVIASVIGGWVSLGSLYILFRQFFARNSDSNDEGIRDRVVGWITELPHEAMSDLDTVTTWLANSVGLKFLESEPGEATFLAAIAVALTFLFFLTTTFRRATSNYGFELLDEDSHLVVARGLFTKNLTRIEKRRIQVITYSMTNRERWFGRGTLLFEQSESEEDHSIRVPFVDETTADTLVQQVYDGDTKIPSLQSKAREYHHISILSFFVELTHRVLIWAPLCLLAVSTVVPYFRQFLWPYALLLPCFMGLASWLKWIKTGYVINRDFLARRGGVFRRNVRLVQVEKVQTFRMSQNMIQRLRATSELSLFYLGGTISIPYLNVCKAHEYRTNVLERIRTRNISWT